jgi:hypothetical protein
MKAYVGVEVQINVFLTSELVGGECSASNSGRFTSGERAPGAHWIGGLGVPQGRSGQCGEVKMFDPTGTRNADPSVVQPVASRYTDCSATTSAS